MNCPKCDAPLLINNYCSKCGVKADYYNKAYNTSNYYYNKALDKAIIRDLTGAVIDLKLSVKYNKKNIQARNLLGLVFFEMGEVSEALSQWVISYNYQEKDNIAKKYIDTVQSNPTKLDTINQTIKKYNQALQHVSQQNYDLALIQLKKVLSLSPNFVNGYLVLGLLYMKNDQNDKAKKAFKRVLRIDANNTLAIKYMRELGNRPKVELNADNNSKEVENAKETNDKTYIRQQRKIITREEFSSPMPISSYKESSFNKYTFAYLLIGLAIGIVVMWVLFIPQNTRKIEDKYKQMKINYNDEISRKNAAIDNLQKENDSLTSSNEDINSQLAEYTGKSQKSTMYEALMTATMAYINGDKVAAAQGVKDLNKDELSSDIAKNLYDKIQTDCKEPASNSLFTEGYNYYSNYNWEQALTSLLAAYEINDQNVDALYFVGRTYHQLGDYENAKKYYQLLIDNFPDSARVANAQAFLNECQ